MIKMEISQTLKHNKSLILLLLGIIFFIVYLYVLNVDLRYILDKLYKINLLYIPLVLLVDILFILTYSVAWFILIKIVCPQIKMKDSILIVIVGWFGDMLIPAAFITGEALRLILLKKHYSLDMSKAAATIVIHRLLNAMAFLFYITTGLIMLSISHESINSRIFYQSLVILILSLTGLFIALSLLKRIYLLREFVKKIGRALFIFLREKNSKIEEKIDNFFNSFEFSLGVMKKYRAAILGSFLILLLQWSLGVAIPYLFFLAVGYRDISFWTLSVAYPIYSLMDNIPLGIPANAGALDIAMISTFVVLGVPREIATLVTLLTRSVIVVFEALLTGSISIVYLSKTFKEISWRNLKALFTE